MCWDICISAPDDPSPSRPLALGQIGTVPFIGLPGNPVAVLVTFMRFARRLSCVLAAERAMGGALTVRTGSSPSAKSWGVTSGLRVRLPDTDGNPVVYKFPQDGAGILTSMARVGGPGATATSPSGSPPCRGPTPWWIAAIPFNEFQDNAQRRFISAGCARGLAHGKEELKLPAGIDTVAGLIHWLAYSRRRHATLLTSDVISAVNQKSHPMILPSQSHRRGGGHSFRYDRRPDSLIRVQGEDFDIGVEIARMTEGNTEIGGLASFVGSRARLRGERDHHVHDAGTLSRNDRETARTAGGRSPRALRPCRTC